MMAYALRSLAGAWHVMNGRPAGLDKLDLTIEGFWRSFAAIALVIPFDALLLAGERADRAGEGGTVPPLTMEEIGLHLLASGLSWIAFVGAAALLLRALGLTDRYVPLIVADNWSTPIIFGIFALPYLLFVAGLVPAAAFGWLVIAVGIPVLAFWYLTLRTALAAGPVPALTVLSMTVLIQWPISSALDPTW